MVCHLPNSTTADARARERLEARAQRRHGDYLGSLRIGLYLSICLQNVSGRVRSGQVCVDSGGETITADHNATEDGEEVVAENDPTVGRWRRLVRLPLLHLVLRYGLRLSFRHPNQHKLVQI